MRDITLPKRSVLGSDMAFREIVGPEGAPVAIFLHGNPTSSYIWRNIIPLVAPVAHCVAPDLIGFGQSDKPDIEYGFFDEARYFDAFIDASGLSAAYLIAQDWGTALAFHLAARRPEFVSGLAFMDFIRPWPTWNDFSPRSEIREIFQMFRTPGEGERLILDKNVFVDGLLPGAITRGLTREEMEVYRAPFSTRESRRPVLRFPRDLPVEGKPADVWDAMQTAHAALPSARYPKLLFTGDPQSLVSPAFAEKFAAALTNCEVIHLGTGIHFLQEDHPETIGRSIARWIARSANR